MKPELRFETKIMRTGEFGEPASVPDLGGKGVLQNHLEFSLEEDDEIYEGFGRRANSYPYPQIQTYRREIREREMKTAVLENDFLRAVFLPELGGRLWELTDKETGRNLLYTNDVIRFSNLAICNAWFSGGVEWNVSLIGHTPFTTRPLYTARLTMGEGIPVLRMYEYERVRGIEYQMDFWLEETGKTLNCRMRIVNSGDEVIPMYWWSNMAVPEYEDGRIIVPAGSAFTYRDGAVYKVDIPVVDGVDVTAYQEIPRSVDYFFDIPREAPKFVADVDRDGFGLLQMSTARLRSRKLFSWGHQGGSDRWQAFLTDRAGRYIEIQAGLGKTQYGCIPMAPHTAWEWLERYGAVRMEPEEMAAGHESRAAALTGRIQEAGIPARMEEILAQTRGMAKEPAQLVLPGSGYGAFRNAGRWTGHLAFQAEGDAFARWRKFFETGILHCPDVKDRPDEFLIDEENLPFLLASLEEKNRDNWYAFYQAGACLAAAGRYAGAVQALERSLALAESPWALHALACAHLGEERYEDAVRAICRGMELAMQPPEYYQAMIWNTVWCAIGIAVGLFLLFGYVQGIFLALSDYKKLGAKRRRELAGTVLGFPAFLILYGITLLVGACSKPSWGKVARNVPPPQK